MIEDQILAAKALVKHLVDRCLCSSDFAYWCGSRTRTRELLVAAAAVLFEIDEEEVERRLNENVEFGDDQPRHQKLETQNAWLEARVAELERKVRALGGEP